MSWQWSFISGVGITKSRRLFFGIQSNAYCVVVWNIEFVSHTGQGDFLNVKRGRSAITDYVYDMAIQVFD